MFFHNHRFCCYIVLPILFSLLSHLPSYPPYGRVVIEVPKTSRAQVTNLYLVATEFYTNKVSHNSNTFKIPTDAQREPDYMGPEPTIIPTQTQLVSSYIGPEPTIIPTSIQRVPHYIGHEPLTSLHLLSTLMTTASFWVTMPLWQRVQTHAHFVELKWLNMKSWSHDFWITQWSQLICGRKTIYILCISRTSRYVNTGHWGPIGYEGGWGRWTRSQSKMSRPSRERRFVRDLLREERNKFQPRASKWQHYLKCEVESCGNTFGFEVVARH